MKYIRIFFKKIFVVIVVLGGLLCLLVVVEELELEKEDLKFGFIKFIDMVFFVIVYEKGYFEDEGLYVILEV